jgi:hypothetical protein
MFSFCLAYRLTGQGRVPSFAAGHPHPAGRFVAACAEKMICKGTGKIFPKGPGKDTCKEAQGFFPKGHGLTERPPLSGEHQAQIV